jgi:hypothetical protein
MRPLAFICCILAVASNALAAAPSLDRVFKLRTKEDWYAARMSAEKSLSQDDYSRFVWALDWTEMKLREEYSEPHSADAICAALLDGRTVRQIIVLGTLLQLRQSVAAELENQALESESTDPEKKKLYRLRANEARAEQSSAQEIVLKYAADLPKQNSFRFEVRQK